MVEAPGFAPGSENTSPQESTMRIRLCGVAPDVKRRKNRQAPTSKNLAADVRDSRQPPACLNDIQFRPTGCPEWTLTGFYAARASCVFAVMFVSICFTRVMVLGTHPAKPYLRRI